MDRFIDPSVSGARYRDARQFFVSPTEAVYGLIDLNPATAQPGFRVLTTFAAMRKTFSRNAWNK